MDFLHNDKETFLQAVNLVSAKKGVRAVLTFPLCLKKIILENSYKVDYETVAERILQESVKYEQAIEALKSI